MKILLIGGTRFFGIHTVNELLVMRHDVTIATRGKAADEYGDGELVLRAGKKKFVRVVFK